MVISLVTIGSVVVTVNAKLLGGKVYVDFSLSLTGKPNLTFGLNCAFGNKKLLLPIPRKSS